MRTIRTIWAVVIGLTLAGVFGLDADANDQDCEDRIVLAQFTWLPPEAPIDIYVSTLDVNQGALVKLTNGQRNADSYGEYGLDGSPDGQSIAFIAYPNTLSIMNVDGTGLRSFTYPNTGLFEVRWSPNGKWIATFMREGISDFNTVYFLTLINAESGEALSIPNAVSKRNPGWMSWSPDSSRIAFSAGQGSEDILWNINIMHIDELTVTPLDGNSELTESSSDSPEWSPDGRFIAFSERTANGSETLRVVDLDGNEIRRVPDYAGGEIDWSYDSRYIAFDDNVHLFVFDIETGSITPVATELPLSPTMAYDWSPDGYRLVVAQPRLWIVDVRSGDVTEIPTESEVRPNKLVWLNCAASNPTG